MLANTLTAGVRQSGEAGENEMMTGAATPKHVRFDLPPTSRTNIKFVKSVNQENDGHEEEQIYR
jgi:hypothetical protein